MISRPSPTFALADSAPLYNTDLATVISTSTDFNLIPASRRSVMRSALAVAFAIGLLLAAAAPVQAQQSPRYGLGLQLMGTTVDDNFGPGFHFRSSVPLTPDVSLGLGAGFIGYIFEGRNNASYAFAPQGSIIVTLPSSGPERTYVLGGGGAYVPFGETGAPSGPTLHAGIGKVWLLNQSSFFLEFNPGLFIGKNSTSLVLPVRGGVIF